MARWLILESDQKSGGFILYVHEGLKHPSTHDQWYSTLEEAVQQAESQFGVTATSWKDMG